MPQRSAEVRDRAVGSLLGLAVGDAVGTTLEFRARDTYEPLTDMVGGGPFDLPVGVWTDDTSMALALADSLGECDGLDPADLMGRFLLWYRGGEYSPTGRCFDIGNTVRDALLRFEKSANPLAGSTDELAAGNGSLMRLSPIAIFGLGTSVIEMRGLAREQSATTHGTRACLDACEAFAVLLRSIVLGKSFADAMADAAAVETGEPIATILSGSFVGKPRDQIRSTGYVAHSLEAALWSVAEGGDYRTIILRAANLGHDADTTAAIAGQVAGAMFGVSGIPADWLEKLAWRHRLTAAGKRLLERTGP